MKGAATVTQLAAFLSAPVVAPAGISDEEAGSRVVTGFASLNEAGPGDLSFLSNLKYLSALPTTRAGAVLVSKPEPTCGAAQIIVTSPDWALGRIVAEFGPKPARPVPGVHPTAVVADDVRLGAGCRIGAYAVIGAGVTIGERTIVHPQVVIADDCVIGADGELFPGVTVRENCRLGDRVIVHNGTVIGADGFGFATVDGVHHKIPQVGIVVIEDDVEIGANTCIDRARFGVTRIGAGTKIDNLVQIAHNVQTGKGCILVAQVAIAGSTKLGNYVTVGGQAGITGHISVADRVTVTAAAGVTKEFAPGTIVRGYPAQEYHQQQRQEVAIRRLPGTQAAVRELEARVAELERRLAGEANAKP